MKSDKPVQVGAIYFGEGVGGGVRKLGRGTGRAGRGVFTLKILYQNIDLQRNMMSLSTLQ